MNHLDNKFAIAVIKDNLPPANNVMLCEALNVAIKALEENTRLNLKVKGLEKIVDSLLKEQGD